MVLWKMTGPGSLLEFAIQVKVVARASVMDANERDERALLVLVNE